MRPKPPACDGCPLAHSGLGFVQAEGPLSAPYILVGEGPGENEATFGTPFFPRAPSGWRLSDWLTRAGIKRGDCYITNAIRCLTVKRDKFGEVSRGAGGRPQKRDPSPSEVRECARRHLLPDLETVLAASQERRILIPIGKPAQLLLTGLAGNRYTGSLQEWNPQDLRDRL